MHGRQAADITATVTTQTAKIAVEKNPHSCTIALPFRKEVLLAFGTLAERTLNIQLQPGTLDDPQERVVSAFDYHVRLRDSSKVITMHSTGEIFPTELAAHILKQTDIGKQEFIKELRAHGNITLTMKHEVRAKQPPSKPPLGRDTPQYARQRGYDAGRSPHPEKVDADIRATLFPSFTPEQVEQYETAFVRGMEKGPKEHTTPRLPRKSAKKPGRVWVKPTE